MKVQDGNFAEAEITAVEVHPKLPGMYRVAVRTSSRPQMEEAEENRESETGWHDEVDALIERASDRLHDARAMIVVVVHEDTLVSMRLLKGRKLTAEEWEGLQREEAREDAYRAALAMLERKSRTSRELSEALKRKGYAADIIQGCIERLQARRMLDDSAYARRYAEQKAATQRKGRKLIRQELLQRGIAKDEADRALAALDANVEQEAADALARKKWPQTKGEPIERKWKVAAFLLRRGYPNAVVRAAVEKAMAEAGEQADGFGDDAEIPEDHA